MKRCQPPLFTRTVYDETALDDCFHELIHAPVAEQDKIEIGCLIQYFMILKHHGLMDLPVDFRKHRQGYGPDFTIISNEGITGAEMTKVTTQDYQVWLKKRLNYRPIRDLTHYSGFEPEKRVAELSAMRVLRKNYKIENYYASVPDMGACDLVLEEDGDCSLDERVLMAMLQEKIARLRIQRYRRISMISGSVLYYAINTEEAMVLYAPDIRPAWLQPPRAAARLWH